MVTGPFGCGSVAEDSLAVLTVPRNSLRTTVPRLCEGLNPSHVFTGLLASLGGEVPTEMLARSDEFQIGKIVIAGVPVNVVDVVTGRNGAVGLLPNGSVKSDGSGDEVLGGPWIG